MSDRAFESSLARWGLVEDGARIVTPSARLLPVLHRGRPAMLKQATCDEERAGHALMAWWDGDGAARVLARDGDTLLMERAHGAATGTVSLAALTHTGRDDEACRIICAVVARLHAPRKAPLPPLTALERWFGPLGSAAATQGGLLRSADRTARALLATPREVGVLHGDIHHDNILDFGPRGWRAIDPKALWGERGFDFANVFCNPGPAPDSAALPADAAWQQFQRRLDLISAAGGLDRRRLTMWILAWCGLSAAFNLEGDDEPDEQWQIAGMAEAELQR